MIASLAENTMSDEKQVSHPSANFNSLAHLVAEYYSLVIESERIYHRHLRNVITRKKDKETKSKTAKLMEEVKCEKQVDGLFTQIMDLQKKNEHLQQSNKSDREKYESKFDRQNKKIQELYKLVAEKSSQPFQVVPQDKQSSEKAIHLLTPRKPMGFWSSYDKRTNQRSCNENIGTTAVSIESEVISDKRKFREVLSQNTIFDKSLEDIVIFNGKRKPTVQLNNGNPSQNIDKIDEVSKENISNASEKSTFSNETFKKLVNLQIPQTSEQNISTTSFDSDNSSDMSFAEPITVSKTTTKKRKLSKNKVISL